MGCGADDITVLCAMFRRSTSNLLPYRFSISICCRYDTASSVDAYLNRVVGVTFNGQVVTCAVSQWILAADVCLLIIIPNKVFI
jgi:archaellum biogenesis ATPase FlaH